jgi:transcriptional antiterminator RfaH
MESWYAVHTKPRSEAIAREHLERQGFRCLFPRLRRTVRTSEGMRDRVESLFPRYVFLLTDAAVQSLAPVRSTRGCVGLVRFGGEPARVPEGIITAIRSRMDADDGLTRLDAPDLVPGQPVRITDGVFAGFDAVFRTYEGAERARLLIDFLGQSRVAVVPRLHLAAHV